MTAIVKGASVLILGAGLAGMTAALELRKAGYKVQVLEYNGRPGGRNWTLRGGDTYTELGGFTQTCEFEHGLYLNPGPWRIPYHHRALLDYCKRLNVALEPFVELNHNALLHASERVRRPAAAHPRRQGRLPGPDRRIARQVDRTGQARRSRFGGRQRDPAAGAQSWGALDQNYAYKANLISAEFRGYAKGPGGGLGAAPVAGEPIALSDILKSRLWRYLQNFAMHMFQTTMFQPVGGMDMIGKAFAKELGDLIRYDAKVTAHRAGRTRRHSHLRRRQSPRGAATQTAKADWCVCTIPLSILSQIPMTSAPA